MKYNFPVTTSLICTALKCPDERMFISHGSIAGQSPYFDGDDWDAVIADLRSIYKLSHGGVRAICQTFGMTHAQLSKRFCIPVRSIENWCESTRRPPDYIIGMMIEILSNSKPEH